MSRLLYWLVIKPISLLPYPILYGFSNFFFVVLYYLVGYRKKVVNDNLRQSFPEKSTTEIAQIQKKFYRHFCDLVVESLKNFSIREEEADRRMVQHGVEIFDELHRKGKSVILAGGHYCNWELWAVASAGYFKHDLIAIYKRLSNTYFDGKMRTSRGRFGLKMIATREYGQYMTDHNKDLTVSVFAIDQSPTDPKKCTWVTFMGRETAAHFGAEKYAHQYDFPVVYGHIYKVRRGYYETRYELVTDQVREMAQGELTQKLHNILEEDIRKAPEYWLWSHKRWKHKRPVVENFQSGAPKE